MKTTNIILVLILFGILSLPCFGNSDFVVKYGQQYICGDSFEIIIPDQPSTTTMVTRKHPIFFDKQTDSYWGTDASMNISQTDGSLKKYSLDRLYEFVQSQAENGEILLPIRIKLRNLTPLVYQGLKPESFQLTGYVRDRKLVYLPEIMEPFDYGGYEAHNYLFGDRITILEHISDENDDSHDYIIYYGSLQDGISQNTNNLPHKKNTIEVTKDYDSLYNKYALFLPLRQLDILLVYRVNPILINWELQVNPQPTYGTSSQYEEITYEPILDQEPCNVVLLFPSIMDGVTKQVIEYERAE